MVKEKPVAPRMYDADGFKKRAACICVRTQAQTEVLLVTSSRMPERWIVPGGSVEPEEDSSMAAMREVEEEAGVRGQLDGMVGVFEDKERKTRTSVYALNVTEELPEWEDSQRIGRRRKWFGVEEAAELLAAYKPIERTYLQMYQESRRESGTASRTDEDDDCEDADVANNSNSISGLNLIRDENARTANNASKLRRRRLKKAPLSSSDVGVVLVASSDSIDASRDDDDDDDDAEEEDGGDRDHDRDADKEPDAEKRGGGKQEPRLCLPDVRQ